MRIPTDNPLDASHERPDELDAFDHVIFTVCALGFCAGLFMIGIGIAHLAEWLRLSIAG